MRGRILAAATAAVCGLAAVMVVPGGAAVAATGSFFSYSGSLAHVAPGAVLRTRTLHYDVDGIPTPVTVTQVLYRTTNARGQAIANATSVLHTPVSATTSRVLSYQSFYDSLNPADSPSRIIAGGQSFGGQAVNVEALLVAPALLAGDDVVITDTEGPTADFAAGPEYGMTTLDALRAVSRTAATGVTKTAKIGLLGYSGGAIATDWAAALAPKYAPDVNRRLVGAAEGGVLVDPDHNLHYIEGSSIWAGVLAMALVGVARSYDLDLQPYLSAYGKKVFAAMQTASITNVLGQYPGMTWSQLARPQYATPEQVPAFVTAANKINLGGAPSPTVPMFIGQGTDGVLEGTAGAGVGDGVMVAGDVRALARQYCAAGTRVQYQQYDLTSHFTTVPLWLPAAYAYLVGRFAGGSAPQNCSSIAAGNSLAPIR